MGHENVSLVIPAYNEGRRIEAALYRYSNLFLNQEIIVVCDGTDNTQNIVKEISQNSSCNIKLLTFKSRLGKGGGVIEGFKVAKGDEIGFIDADESIEPSDLKKMLDFLSDFDGVIASRRLDTSKILVKQPLKRRILSRIFNIIIVRLIFGLDFKDTQCGAKIFKKEVINSVLNDLKTTGFEFDVELLWRLKRKGYDINEYPITWKHSEYSSFSLSNAPKMFISLLGVRIWK